MGDFNRGGGGRGGYGGNRGGGRGGFGGGRGDRQMHHAVCAKCGNDCEVPFRPTGDKPVYCSNCFERPAGNDRRSSDRGGSRGGSSPDYTAQFDALNKKLDMLIDLLTEEEGDMEVEEVEMEAEAQDAPKAEKAEEDNIMDEIEL